MSAPRRRRDVQLNFRVSQEELTLIEQKMSQLGTKNREAYLRKMALDGYAIRLDLRDKTGFTRAEGAGVPIAPEQQ